MHSQVLRLDEAAQLAIDGSLEPAMQHVAAQVTAVRRHLHAHPEPSGEETETTRFLAERLRAVGLQPELAQRELGIVVDCELGRPSAATPRIALRADIDALRIQDEKEVSYRSRVAGLAHCCGHDAHSAIVLGSAFACRHLQQTLDGRWPGPALRLRLLFQPAEETCQGAKWLIDHGALEGVDAVLGLHVDPELPAGRVGIRYGVLTANCDELDILIDGRGGHAARPHHTADPIAAAVQFIGSLYQNLPRAVDSRDPHVLTIGKIAGGSAPNVIPPCVELRGSLRTVSETARRRLMQRIEQIAAGIGSSTNTDIHVRFLNELPGVVNAEEPTAALHRAAFDLLGEAGIEILERPSMGGEDFALYTARVPGAMLRLGCARPGASDWPMLHSPVFDIDESALQVGLRVLLRSAVLLGHHLYAKQRGQT